MARFYITCDVDNSADIYLTTTGYLKCSPGTLQVIEYKPSLSDLDQSQANELVGATALIFGVAWVLNRAWKSLLK
jgi:hypothetical protein